MKICLVNEDKTETIMEHEAPYDTQELRALDEYYKLDKNGMMMPVFVPKLRGKALDEISKHVKNKYPKES
jgi:hypothetical protein